MQQSLYLVRHGNASTIAEIDAQRCLSPKGEKQLDRLNTALRDKNLITPDQIWHSELIRTQQPAHRLKAGLDLIAPLATHKNLAPEDYPSSIAKKINQVAESIMIVGHEPNLSILSSLLLSKSNGCECIVFPTASILCLSRLAANEYSTPWQIEWHISHRLFKT